jgi:hypothetical protein
VARRTSRRTTQRQMAMHDAQSGGNEPEQQYAPPPPAAPGPEAYAAELEQLAKLRDQGILTPEEFEAKKKQVLGI